MNITRRYEIDAGHRVPGHEGKCRFLHGHRYAVEVTVEGAVSDDTHDHPEAGMVCDFGLLKQAMATTLDLYDHHLMLWSEDPLGRLLDVDPVPNDWGVILMPVIPTAERLAELWADEIGEALASFAHGEVVACRVWETPNCSAVWTP